MLYAVRMLHLHSGTSLDIVDTMLDNVSSACLFSLGHQPCPHNSTSSWKGPHLGVLHWYHTLHHLPHHHHHHLSRKEVSAEHLYLYKVQYLIYDGDWVQASVCKHHSHCSDVCIH